MAALWFTVLGVALYMSADRILELLERWAGRRFEYRSLVFFVLLLALALLSFSVVRRYTG